MITLRSIKRGDIALFHDSSYGAMSPESMSKMMDESICKEHSGHYFEIFSVMNEDVCVGFVSLYGLSDTEISCGPEIKPQYRKHGFAYIAVKHSLEYAKQIGYTYAVAQVRQDNCASIALHRKLGFDLCEKFVNKNGHFVFLFKKSL